MEYITYYLIMGIAYFIAFDLKPIHDHFMYILHITKGEAPILKSYMATLIVNLIVDSIIFHYKFIKRLLIMAGML